jgi:hypothetical protein
MMASRAILAPDAASDLGPFFLGHLVTYGAKPLGQPKLCRSEG